MKTKCLKWCFKNVLLNFVYFVCCATFMLSFLHFTTKLKNAKCETKPIKIEQISNIKTYKNKNKSEITSENINKEFPKIKFIFKGKIYYPNKKVFFSETQKRFVRKGFLERVRIMKFAKENGFSSKESVLYSFPELEKPIEQICENSYIAPEDARLEVVKNTAQTVIKPHKNGAYIDENAVFSEIFDKFASYKEEYCFNINQKEIIPNITTKNIEKINFVRSTFSTKFKTSSVQRKNNIKKALSCFDGVVLNAGETLSFNQTTGIRNSENGYEKAKIIKNGMFVDEFGGGVCQVSSTLYNASLLAGLEIVESHSHSLPVSYVEPGFDAMVNIGSSDLVIKNNNNFPILIATSGENDTCLVKIYGEQNMCKYVKKHNKINENIHFDTVFTCDNELYNLPEMEDGKEYIIHPGKAGFTVETTLETYENGVLVQTKNLRKSTYNPTKRVVLISKNDYKTKVG